MPAVKDELGFNQVYSLRDGFRRRFFRRAEWISLAMAAANGPILELGSGHGDLANFISKKLNKKVIGIDRSEQFIKSSKLFETQHLSFVKADILEYLKKQQVESIGCIYGVGILHHLIDQMDELTYEISRTLKPQGAICFLEPNSEHFLAGLIFNTRLGKKLFSLEPNEKALSKNELNLWVKTKMKMEVQSCLTLDYLLPGIPDLVVPLIEKLEVVTAKQFFQPNLSQSILISAIKESNAMGRF